MKYIAPIATLALIATQASAGSLVTPEIEPALEVVQEQPASSSDWIVPLLAVGLIAVMVTNSGGGTPTPTPC
jgi:hypothetical protein